MVLCQHGERERNVFPPWFGMRERVCVSEMAAAPGDPVRLIAVAGVVYNSVSTHTSSKLQETRQNSTLSKSNILEKTKLKTLTNMIVCKRK